MDKDAQKNLLLYNIYFGNWSKEITFVMNYYYFLILFEAAILVLIRLIQ